MADFAGWLRVSDSNAEVYLQALVDAGYLELRENRSLGKVVAIFDPTRLGTSLRKSRKTKRMSRAGAEEAVDALVREAERINGDPALLNWVDELDIFGSYLTDATDLGDVDVAVGLSRRLPTEKWITSCLDRAAQVGSRYDFITRAYWGEFEVWRALEASSRRLDLQPKGEIVRLGIALRPIYRRREG